MYIPVLNKGYVRLLDKMGGDISVVNAARVSYDKRVEELSDNDYKLLRYLIDHNHTSPLRHASISLEVYAPLMVARQWWKYAVSSTHIDDQNGWNETSRRYVTDKEEFYIPREWRSRPLNSKQGSGDILDTEDNLYWSYLLEEHITRSRAIYERALASGLAPELARIFLPAYGLYVRWIWTVSLQGVLHFLDQRLEDDAQIEIQSYARAVKEIVEESFPATFSAWTR